MAFGTGLVSVYSSTSGVVLPAFLPMAPELAQRLGGIDPLNIAWSMNVSASLVDLSSLSTVGALLHRGRGARHRREGALQRPARLGPVDVGRRRLTLLDPVRLSLYDSFFHRATDTGRPSCPTVVRVNIWSLTCQ